MSKLNLLEKTIIAPLVKDLAPLVIDLGARGGVDEDFLSAAWASTVYGFEPEIEECNQLEKINNSPWKNTVIVPNAVGEANGKAKLHSPLSLQGSSLLPHNPEMIDLFGYSNLHKTIKVQEVETLTLDEISNRYDISYVDYLKVDVEGAELDILQAAPSTLKRCTAIKVETSFLKQRQNQPLTHEIISFLCKNGFWLVDIIDIHRWRRRPVPAHPYIINYDMPYSKGVLAQCDLIFLKDFRLIKNQDEALRLSIVALILSFFDYSISVLKHFPNIAVIANERYNMDLEIEISKISSAIGKQECKGAIYKSIRGLFPLIRSCLGMLPFNKNLSSY